MPAVHGDLLAAVIATDRDIPDTIFPRQVTLRDRVTVATLVPISSADDVPPSLMRYLSDQLNKEIAKGDTYAMVDPIPLEQFATYWFFNFGAIMLLGDIKSVYEMKAMERAGADWTKICLGSFNIRPNYPGRSSHVCNGMFLVTDAARNRGVGRLMGEGYLEWAPKLVSKAPPSCRKEIRDRVRKSLTVNRVTPMPSSTWFTRATWLLVGFGMLLALSGSVRCQMLARYFPAPVNMSMQLSMGAT